MRTTLTHGLAFYTRSPDPRPQGRSDPDLLANLTRVRLINSFTFTASSPVLPHRLDDTSSTRHGHQCQGERGSRARVRDPVRSFSRAQRSRRAPVWASSTSVSASPSMPHHFRRPRAAHAAFSSPPCAVMRLPLSCLAAHRPRKRGRHHGRGTMEARALARGGLAAPLALFHLCARCCGFTIRNEWTPLLD